MTPVMLMLSLKALLETELADTASAVPTVHLGYLPGQTAGNTEATPYPVILIRPIEGQGDKESTVVQIKLLFSTQSEDDSGLIDLLNLMERVRILLLRQRILDHQFRIDPNWKWKFYEDQPVSEWLAELVTTWAMPQIRQEVYSL